MKRPVALALLPLALALTACSSEPTAPSSTSTSIARDSEGRVSQSAITVTRIRLRRVGGADIVTDLKSGAVVDIPLDTAIDIWAEIARLETDRSRLLVDWGEGEADFTGCGACRLEHTYTREGKYILRVSIVDLNGSTGSQNIGSAIVTLNVFDFDKVDQTPSCAAISEDFESRPDASFPVTYPGVRFLGVTGGVTALTTFLGDREIFNDSVAGAFTIVFDEDQNRLSLNWAGYLGQPVGYIAYDARGTQVDTGTQLGAPQVNPTGFPFQAGALTIAKGIKFRRVVFFGPDFFDDIVSGCN